MFFKYYEFLYIQLYTCITIKKTRIGCIDVLTQELFKNMTLPALFLDLKALDDNCQAIAKKANGKKIRIATKSIRSVPVLKRILSSSPVFEGLMCFSSQEALFLIDKGFDNLLIGYPCTDSTSLLQIAQVNQTGKRIICMVDDLAQIEILETLAKQAGGTFFVCIDVDMSSTFGPLHFGVRRSPLANPESVLHLTDRIIQSSYLTLTGIMGYEAQIAGIGDLMPGQQLKNTAIFYMQQKSIREVAKRRKDIVQIIQNKGIHLSLVNGGGTGSLHSTATEAAVTELTAGSGFYAPLLFDYYKSFSYQPALYFALPIVRKPTAHIYTCLGGGYIGSGATGKDKQPQPIFPPGGRLLSLEGAGEVQTPVYYEKADLQIGDAIVFRAAKAGEICERFSQITCISNGQIVEQYPTYRGEGVCFL